jgi:hypothetical protein
MNCDDAITENTGKFQCPRNVPCGHSVMIDMPDRLTEILFEMA